MFVEILFKFERVKNTIKMIELTKNWKRYDQNEKNGIYFKRVTTLSKDESNFKIVDSTFQKKVTTIKNSKCLTLLNDSQLAKMKVFLTCHFHEIYRDKAVGLKSCKYTWKNTIYVNMWNLGQFRENLIFCQTA